jgi:NAD(P)-dependent dehydrogenase (short-subunit alcohol dehydrogenase family)
VALVRRATGIGRATVLALAEAGAAGIAINTARLKKSQEAPPR